MKKAFFSFCIALIALMLWPSFVMGESSKPVVIPNIQEWTGGNGNLTLPVSGRICYEQDELAVTANVLRDDLLSFTNISRPVIKTAVPQAGDIYLTLTCSDTTIGTEGYLMDTNTYIKISANADAGVFYGTRTLLQILKQDAAAFQTVPIGSIKDYPKYKERGFMLDVARKYFTPQYLENYIRQMAWFKLNDFHIHFTDDQGIRLKSDNYPGISSNQYYSKAYLRTLQDLARKYHVTITPEIDLPGHASAVVNAYPETGHASGTPLNPAKYGLRPIDLSKDASWNIAYGLLDEFAPLFDAPEFHIGGDEYPAYGNGAALNSLLNGYPALLTKAQSMGLQTEADLYYHFLNSMGNYVKTRYNKTPRFWEWSERFAPYTSIGIENDMIFDSWEGAEAINRSAAGFKIINSNWRATYIVPGTNMYPDMEALYQTWQPNYFDLTGTTSLNANDENLLGAKLCNWNDDGELYNEGGIDRFTLLPLAVFSEDIWGAQRRANLAVFKSDILKVGNAPGHGVDLVGAWKFEEGTGTSAKDTSGYNKSAVISGPAWTTSGKYGKALVFDGVDDMVKINQPDINGAWTISMWVNKTESLGGNAILMDSENASIKLEQVSTRSVGFTNKITGQDYSFSYTVPAGTWINLTFTGDASQTKLYVNGTLSQTLPYGIKCPMDNIGAGAYSAKGMIDEVKIYARELDAAAITSLQNSMLLYMPFEDSNARTASDVSGALYNGTLKAPAQKSDSGKKGKGVLLSNGSSQVVLCHNDVSGPWTASIWVNKEAGSAGGPILRSNLSAIGINSMGKPQLTINGVADYSFTAGINDDTWTNLTFTSDGVSQTALYINGEYKETLNMTIDLPLFTLGHWWQGFNGRIDELKVYDRVLGANEIYAMVGYTPWINELTTNSVHIKWNLRTGAEGYNIYRSDNAESGFTKLNANPLLGNDYTDYNLTTGTTYYYKLTYITSGIESPQSDTLTVNIPEEVLLSLNKPATAQYSEAGHEPQLANDNFPATYWGGSTATKWWRVDLEEQYDLSKIKIVNYADGVRYYQYIISVSSDGSNWTQVASKTNNAIATDEGEAYTISANARYVKVDMTYCSADNYVHIGDFKVYGQKRAVPPDMVGYWKFYEGSGTIVADSSGSSNNGVITGATWSPAGKQDKALYFGGSNEHVKIGRSDISGSWTAAMWVKREDSANVAAVLVNSPNYSLRLEQSYNSDKVGFTELGIADKTFNYTAPVGTWVHMTFVGTTSSTSLYVNGVFQEAIAHGIKCPMDTLGNSYDSMKGYLDEVRIYNRALTGNEISDIYSGSAYTLISQGKPVTASSHEVGHDAQYANDTDRNTYWSSVIDDYGDSWLQVDLQGNHNISSINIRNYADGARYYKYYIRASLDGYNWVPLSSKNDAGVAADAGDTYTVKTVARYVRVNVVYNSANGVAHISDFNVYGIPVNEPSADSVSGTDFTLDKSSYMAGDNAYLSYSLKNNTTESLTINKVIIRKFGLTNPLIYDQMQLASNINIAAGITYTANSQLIWSIPSQTELGAYGFWLTAELSNGEIYDFYSSFARVVDNSTLTKYTIGKQDYNGLSVYTLDGGMSAEATVEKSLESLDSATSHTWYIQSNGGPNYVYSSESFLEDSIQQTVDYYNNYLGASTQFDTVILATGNCGVNYLSRVTKAPVLPTQFLVSVNSYKELRKVVDHAKDSGIPTYSTLGYDGSMGIGVAWLKMLDLPQAYKSFLIQHGVKNIIIVASSGATSGESIAKKAMEDDTVLSGTSNGDIYVMYPNGGTAYDMDQLSRCIKDVRELNLESSFRNFSDWESGMIPSQINSLSASATTAMGSESSVIFITSDDSKYLYDFTTYAVCKFYKKNEAVLGTNPIQGIAINPYLMAHPAYETMYKYVPVLFWQGNYNGQQIVDTVVGTFARNAIMEYFPNTDFNAINYWVNYANNFGGQVQATQVKNELIADGLTNITENNLTNEIWNPSDGMSAPVEVIAQNIITNSSPAEMKNYYNSLSALDKQDLMSIMQVFSGVEIIDLSGGALAYWSFDEGSGTIATDLSGNGNNGIINGASWSTSGKNGGALYFDGSNNYVDIGKTDLTGSWTAAMWIKREDSSNVASTVMHSSSNSLRAEQYNNSNNVGFTRVGIADKTFNYSAPLGTWVHLAYVGTPEGTSLYVNGILQETIDYSIGCPMDKIGCDYDSFKGYLDDVKIFNRALSSSEISSLAQ